MNPTAGVDVAAKRSIYETVRTIASRGKAVIIVSSDDADFALCHRVIVMFRGEVHKQLDAPFTEIDVARSIQGE
jgi:simple sugar transport system ATP-binding protein